MDVKIYLRQYIPALKYAEQCARQLDSLRHVWIRSPRLDGMPRGNMESGLDRTVAMIDQAERRLDRAREKALRILLGIEDILETVEDFEEATLLRKRYIDGLTWQQIAIEMHWSESSVRRMHGRALEELRRKKVYEFQSNGEAHDYDGEAVQRSDAGRYSAPAEGSHEEGAG